MARYILTKGMFPGVKRGEPGFWLNEGEVEYGYGEWHWAIDTETSLPVMIMFVD